MFFSKPKLQHMNPYMEPTEPEDPASSLDVLQAYGSEAWRRFNMGSGTINLGEAYQDYIDKAEKLTGKKLRNPEYYGVDADPEIRQKYWSDWNQYREDGGQLSGSVYRRMWQEREFRRQIDDFVKAHPDLKDQLTPPDQSFESQGRQKATDASEAAQETWMRSRQGWLDYAASTAGSFGGAMGDPINIMTMPFGFGGVGTGVKGIWTGFLKAGIANATVEGMVQPIVKGYNNQLGTPYGWGDVGISLGSAFLLGGGVDAGFRQAYRSLAGRFGYVPIKNSDGYVVAWRRKVPSLGGTPSLEAELRPLSEIPTDLMQRAQQGDPAAIADIASRLTEAQKATGETVIPHTTMQQAAEGDMGALRQVAEPEAKTDPVVKMMLDAAEADERLLVAPDPKIPEADHAATMAQTLRHIDEPDLEPLPVRTETVDVAPEIVPKLEAEIRELRAKAETPDAETQARIDELEAQIRQIDTFGRDPVQDAMMIREGAFQITNDVDLGNPGVRQARSLAALSDEAFAQVTKGEAAPELGALVADHAVPELHGRLLSDLTARQPVSLDDAKAQLVEILGSPDYRPHVEDVQGPVAQSAKSPRQLDDPTGPEAKAQVQRLEQELREELAAGGREPPPMEQILADPQAREVLISRADEVRTAIAQMADIVPPGTEVRVFDSIDMLPSNIRASVRAANGKAFAAAVDAFQGAKSVAERHKARQALDAASRQQGVEGIANDGVIWIASYAMNPQGRIAHEVVHALRTSGRISPDEVRVLATAARDLDVFHSDLEAMYRADLEGRVANVDAILEEEAAAHMIDAVVRGEVPAGRVVEPQVASLVDRIKEFFAKVRSALTGRGFVSPETVPVRRPEQDVIATLLSGEMAKREARADWMRDNVIKDWAQITESKVNGDGSVLLAMRHSDEKTGQSMRADLDRLGYFSGALEAAKRLRQNKGTPEQMLAMLQKEGAKKTEIEATGLDKLLSGKPADGYVRLYRAEPKSKSGNIPDWVAESDEFKRTLDATGRWFTDAEGNLDFYKTDIGKDARIVYVDVPANRVENYRVSNISKKSGGKGEADNPAAFSRDPDTEFFLPRDIASTAKEKNKSITKSEIIKYLEDNRVDVREVERGLTQEQLAAEARMNELRDQMQAIQREDYQRTGGFRDEKALAADNPEYAALVAEYDALSARNFGPDRKANEPTKWQPYSLDPNNPTYRETVLHLPLDQRKQAELEGMSGQAFTDESLARAADLSPFRSGHFPEPNIIGHMQTSLVKHEGKPTYLIDQIQSDWGQKLRDGGVRDEAKIAELKKAADDIAAKEKEIVDAGRDPKTNRLVRESDWFAVTRDRDRINAELRTAEAATPGHPLVNTTDQWTTTTLRRAIRQAVEADAEYIAVPHGDTVLSYNPGDTDGMRGFYGSRNSDGIVPKNLKNILRKIDKNSPAPQKVESVETPSGMRNRGDNEDVLMARYDEAREKYIEDMRKEFSIEKDDDGYWVNLYGEQSSSVYKSRERAEAELEAQIEQSADGMGVEELLEHTGMMPEFGFTLFPLTDKVKQSVKEQGQPLFAMRGLDMSPEARKQRAEEMGFDTSRVLYHGTKQTFMRFAREKLGVNTGAASATKAFFFADNPRVASGYAMERGSMVLDGIQKKEAQDLVRRIAKLDGEIEDAAAVGDFDRADFLSAEREAIYSQIDEIERDGAQVVPVYLRMKNPLVVDYKGKSRGANTYASVLEKAQKDGHDGVIFKNTFDSMLHEDKPHDVYAVFDPTNIRSVNAAFDPSEAGSANLMFAMRDFDKDLADRAVKHFGLTRDASEAGYILPDGRMLDFTGRHYAGGVWNESIQAYRLKERDYLAGTRSVDHRELEDLTESGGTDGMHEFMRRSGAIRYQSHTGGFEAFYPPSEAQIRAILRSHSQRFRGEPLDIDVGDPATGEIIKSVSLERPTVRKVLEVFGGNKDDGVMFALRDLSRRLDAPLVDDLGKSDPHPGRVMAVHGTKAPAFDQFDPAMSADFGSHFGTKDQADIPAGYTTTRENARMIPVVLDLKTVVDVPDMMTWPPVEVAAAVEKAYPLARGLEDRVRAVIAAGSTETGPTGSVRPSREALDAGKAELRRLMTEAKIDGLRYWNDSEGEGWSYIVWDEGKVSSATSGEPMMGVKPDGNPEFAKPAAQPQPEQPRIQAPDIRSFADQIQALTQDMPMLTRADDGAVDSVRMGDQVYRVVRGEDGSVQGVTIDAEAPGAAQLDSAGLAAQITPRLMEIAQQYGIDADAVSSIASRVADDVANGTDLTDALTRQLQDALPDQAQASQPLYGMMDAKGRVKPGAQKRAEDLAADLAEIEAELKGANIDEREALQRKRASLLNAIAADKVLDDARAYRSARGEEDPAKGLMHLIESEGVHGGAMDVVTLKNIIQGKALSMMDELVWEFRKGAFLGDVRRTANTAVRTRMENVIREAAGEKTSDPLAASMGKAWLEVAEYLRQRFNAAGGDIGKLKGWFAPQYHDVDALVKAGRQVWVDYMMKDGVLDWERMTKSDGSQLTVAERRDLLRDIWRTITTDGAEKREVTGFAGKGAMYKRHADHRVLHFKNADAYLKYTKEFGSGDVYAMMMGHVNVMSRDIAAMERFGANPDVVLERVRQQLRIDAELAQTPRSMFDDLTDLVAEIKEFKSDAIKTRVDATLTNLSKAYDKLDRIKRKSALRGSVSQQQAKLIAEIANAHMALNDLMVTGDMQPRALVLAERIVAMQDQMLETATRYSVKSKDPVERANTYLRRGEEMWKLYKGSTNVPGNSRAADAMQGFRNWTSASILVKASISAISDQAIGMAARAFIGMPVHKQLTSFIKGFSKADRKAALRFRVGLDQAMTAASVQSRYAGYVNTRSVTGYIADRTHAFSGLSPMTQAAKVGFSSDFMAWMAELAATTPYQKLDRWIQQMLERHRISADDWAALRTVTPDMDRGVAKLSSEAIERDVGEDLAERYMAALFRERAMAVIDPTLRGRTAFISETKPGTVIGEMLRSVAMVKSFPTSYATLVLGRLYNQIASGRGMDTNSIAYGTAILFLGMAFGGLAIQLKDITSGADPQDMTEPEFWAKAFMQSGGAGIFGDFIMNSANRHGNGLATTIMGPMADRGSQILDATVGNVLLYAQDEKTSFGRKATGLMRSMTPGAFVPFYLRAAYERAVIDGIQKQIDPDSYRSFRSRIRSKKKFSGNEYFWPPGSPMPGRGPRLERALGQ